MTPQSVLGRTFTVSLLFHAGLLGGLILFASRPPVLSDTPLRVRILEEPAPRAVPEPPVPAAPLRQTGRFPVEAPRRGGEREKPEVLTERLAPPPVPIPDKPAPPPPQPPQVAARPSTSSGQAAPEGSLSAPKAAAPPAPNIVERPPEAPRAAIREPLPPTPPERGGLILRGPSQSGPLPPPASSEPTVGRPSRPSLREQIASLGSYGDMGEAKRTISLDDRNPDYLPYLERLKQRVYNVWLYPQEARDLGLGGEVQLIFTLNKGGSLTGLRLVQSSGFPVLDNEALRAIQAAAPFEPTPPQWGDGGTNIRGIFQYGSHARYRRN